MSADKMPHFMRDDGFNLLWRQSLQQRQTQK